MVYILTLSFLSSKSEMHNFKNYLHTFKVSLMYLLFLCLSVFCLLSVFYPLSVFFIHLHCLWTVCPCSIIVYYLHLYVAIHLIFPQKRKVPWLFLLKIFFYYSVYIICLFTANFSFILSFIIFYGKNIFWALSSKGRGDCEEN